MNFPDNGIEQLIISAKPPVIAHNYKKESKQPGADYRIFKNGEEIYHGPKSKAVELIGTSITTFNKYIDSEFREYYIERVEYAYRIKHDNNIVGDYETIRKASAALKTSHHTIKAWLDGATSREGYTCEKVEI